MRTPLATVRRIAAMSFDEVRTRVKAAIRQRLDMLEIRQGKNPLQPLFSDRTQALPRFFFDEGEASIVASEVRRRLPSECQSVIQSAQRIRAHQFDLLGYRGLTFGDQKIDWHLDPVHRIVAPQKSWFHIPYLDGKQVGDHKIIWELSRHQHLMLLARAWLFTGDGQFLETLENLWESWRAANPYPIGINWASSLEVSLRCISWIWVDHLTAGASAFSQTFRTELRQGIGECAVYIERYLSTYFAPNTHLLGELLALFFVGLLYPGFDRAQSWREYGWRTLLEESSRQVREDGFHFEQSVYYHVYALDMFLHARILAARNGVVIPEDYDKRLRLMGEALAAIGAAGQVPRFGDDDGGRLFDGRRNRTEHMLDPIATAAIVYARGDWKAAAGNLREETIWLLGVNGTRLFDQLPAASHVPRSLPFTSSGYFVMASANAVAVIDAGPHGWGNGGHAHADALSMQVIAGGRAWLTDPGTGSYMGDKPERDLFRSTAAHNTLEVDRIGQADPLHAFAWRSHPRTSIQRWYSGEKLTIFAGAHDGYSRLTAPVLHRRWVIGWHDDLWMVLDRASGEGVHQLDLRWHVAPECNVINPDRGNLWRLQVGEDTMEIIVPELNQWSAARETGSWSPAYGAVIPAPVLHFSRKNLLPANFVTLLAFNQRDRVSLTGAPANGANAYLLKMGQLRRLVVIADEPGHWQFGIIESDADLLVIEWSASTISHLLIAGGSGLQIGSETPSADPKANGVWEGTVAATKQPLLSSGTATALLEALERL